MSDLDFEADYWTRRRITMRVLLEQLEAVAEGDACQAHDCHSVAEVRQAIDTIDWYLDAMPIDCDHQGARR
jgi:hypothetical protein